MSDINPITETSKRGPVDIDTQLGLAEIAVYLTELNTRLFHTTEGKCPVHHIIESPHGYQCFGCGQRFALLKDE